MGSGELDRFIETWNREARQTLKLLRVLPESQYDFRPDPGARSLGELAWHLAEVDGYMSFALERGSFERGVKAPGLERPRTIAELAPGYERVHEESVARIRKLKPEDLERPITFIDGRDMQIRYVLWGAILHHLIHHRGQLTILCRLGGGVSPSIVGPNREDWAALQQARSRG